VAAVKLSTSLAIAGVSGALALVALWPRKRPRARSSSGSSNPTELPSEDDNENTGGTDMGAVKVLVLPNGKAAVGEATQPDVAALLAEMGKYFRDHGVDTSIVSPFDVTVMPKAPLQDGWDEDEIKTRPVAIPARESWGTMATLLREVTIPIVRALPFDVRVTGYRPADYNKAVKGAPKSAHTRNGATDIWIKGNANMTSKNARTLMLTTAQFVLDHPTAPLGFGAYTFDVHVDLAGRRTWEKAAHWLDEAKKVS
jgi:hypothetical protein